MNFLELKPLTTDLLEEVVELDRRCLGGLWSVDGYQREIDSPNSDLLVLQQKRSLDESPLLVGLGCLWSIAEEAHITVLAVEPNYQRQGLGQILLYAMLSSAFRQGLEWATLEVKPSNQAAINLYEKFGFREVGRRKQYYQDTGEDALILWRHGIQKPEFLDFMRDQSKKVAERIARSNAQIMIPEQFQITGLTTVSALPLDFKTHFS